MLWRNVHLRVVVAVGMTICGVCLTSTLTGRGEPVPSGASHAPAGQLCLTFDDAPTGEGAFLSGDQRTRRLIGQFKSLGIPQVAFFCVTERLAWHHGHKRLEQYARAGHLIANHTHTHPAPESNGAAAYIAGIRQADDSLRQFATFTPWFRYPFLNEGRTVPVRDSIRSALRDLGYRNGYVTIDTWDWYLDRRCREAAKAGMAIDTAALGEIYVQTLWQAVQFYDQMARDILGSVPKHVLLLHENDLAALYIGDLVSYLREHDWEIISPTEAYSDPIAGYVSDGLFSDQGRIAAMAADRGYDGPLRQPSEDTDYLDSLLEARHVFKNR